MRKPGTLARRAEPLVERRDMEAHALRPIALVGECETCEDELQPAPLPGQVGPQAEAVVEVGRPLFEVVETDRVAVPSRASKNRSGLSTGSVSPS